jgi:hypothetical protein
MKKSNISNVTANPKIPQAILTGKTGPDKIVDRGRDTTKFNILWDELRIRLDEDGFVCLDMVNKGEGLVTFYTNCSTHVLERKGALSLTNIQGTYEIELKLERP